MSRFFPLFFGGLVCVVIFVGSVSAGPADADRERGVIERFQTLLEKTPRRGTSLDRVYGYHVDAGQVEQLIDRCRRRTENEPDGTGADADAWLLLGLVLSRSGDDTEAAKAFEKSLALEPGKLLAGLYLGEIHVAQGRLRQAAETLNSVLNQNPRVAAHSVKDLLAVLQTLGRVYERFGDRPNAERIWNRLEELFPDDNDIRLRIAETLEEEGKWDEALRRYKILAENAREPFDRVRFTLAAAEIKIRKGETGAAVADFERLLDEISSENWLAGSIRDRLERIFMRNADDAGLDSYYEKRLEKRPDEIDSVRRRAAVLVRLGKTGEAKSLLTATLDRAPSSVLPRLALIDLLVAEKDFQSASEQYAEVDRLEPNHPDHLVQWGLVTLENTKLDEAQRKPSALKIWKRILTAKPDDVSAVITVAELAAGAGIDDEAEQLYKKAVELMPNDPGYVEYLGYFYHHRQRKDEAVTTFRRIADGARRSPANLTQLAGIFRSLGYADEAIETYRKAVKLEPNDFELRIQYAALLLDHGDFDAAETEYRTAENLLDKKEPNEQTAKFLRDYVNLLRQTHRLDIETENLRKMLNDNSSVFDFWRLAVLETARGRTKDAATAIDRALKISPPESSTAIVLWDAAATMFLNSGDKKRAVEIYVTLTEIDMARRVDHLRRLANLYRELGDTGKALETARLAMAVGAGNPANARFYAELLIAAKRQREAIETLRRAVRLDPGDEVTLNMLAEALFVTNRVDEAIEITWRVFEKTEDLQGKLGIVSRLASYYRTTKKFPQLFQRLRMTGRDAVSRRESVFCTAQVHITENEYDKARKTLETLLLDIGDEKTDDIPLLSQLSRITEHMGDFPAAIRYQEMLCEKIRHEKTRSVEEAARLLSLYRLAGQRDKPVEHLLRALAEKGKLHEQIHAVDDFLSREEYASARQLLDRIEMKHPMHWELRYRRLMLDAWQGNLESAEKHATAILSMNIDRNELSEKKRNEKSTDAATTNIVSSIFLVPGNPGQAGWQFEQNRTISVMESTPPAAIQQRWSHTNSVLLQTICREILQYVQPRPFPGQQRSARTVMPRPAPSPKVPPPKPQFAPERFGDARFAAVAWLLRILPNDRVVTFLTELRAKTPISDADTERLTERLRWETFLQQLVDTSGAVKKLGETDHAKLFLGGLADDPEATKFARIEAGERLRHKIAYELALRGERDWYPVAFREVLRDLYIEYLLEHLPDVGPGGELERRFDESISQTVLREIFSSSDLQEARNMFFKTLRELKDRPADSALRNGQRLELLQRCWDEIERRTFEHRPGGVADLYLLLSDYPLYVKTLRQRGLAGELGRSREILKNLSKRVAWVRAVYADAVVAEMYENAEDTDSFSSLVELVRLHRFENRQQMFFGRSAALHGVWHAGTVHYGLGRVSMVYDFLRWQERPISPVEDDRRYEKFLALVETLKDDILADRSATRNRGNLWGSAGVVPSPEAQFDSLFAKYLDARLRPLRHSLSRFAGGNLGQNVFFFHGGILVHYEAHASSGAVVTRTVDAATLEGIAAAEKETYRVLDTYFELMEELAEELADLPTDETEPSVRKPSPAVSSEKLLARFQRAFDHVDADNDRFRQRQSPTSILGRLDSPEVSLMLATGFFRDADDFSNAAKPRGDIDTKIIRKDFLHNFDAYLLVRSRTGTDSESAHIEAFRQLQKQFAQRQVARFGDGPKTDQPETPLRNVVEILEHDVRRAVESGRKPDPRKLVMLAIQEKRRSRFEKAVEYLDAVPLDNAAEIRLREFWVLRMFVLGAGPETLKDRAAEAVKRFSSETVTKSSDGEELLVLQRAQELLGQTEEAEKNRDRLMESVPDSATLLKLLEEFKQRKETRNPKVVAFAMKTFWLPRYQKPLADWNSDGKAVREILLDIVAEAGRLDELIEGTEATLKESGNDISVMASLAELHFRAGNREKLEAIIRKIDEGIGGPLKGSQAYLHYLDRTGMAGPVARWRLQLEAKAMEESLKSFDADPGGILKNLATTAGHCEKYKLSSLLLEMLNKNESEPVALSFGELVFFLELWLDRSETREAARQLLRHLWAMEKTDEKSRREIRLGIVSAVSHRTKYVEYYPLFRDVLLDYIRTGQPERYETPQGNRAFDPFRVTVWGLDRCFCLVTTFLDLAEKDGKLHELVTDLHKLLETPLSTKGETTARLLLAMSESRLGRGDQAVEAMKKLHEMLAASPGAWQIYYSADLVLAQELASLDAPKALELASAALDRTMKSQAKSPRPDNRTERVVKSLQELVGLKRR